MKILHINIIDNPDRPLLNGLQIDFPLEKSTDAFHPNIFIGVNGSGKSQLLETMADIFLYLDRVYRKVNHQATNPTTPILFEIDYLVSHKKSYCQVNIKHTNKRSREPEISVRDKSNKTIHVGIEDITNYLPQKVVGYTSGDNETLSLPFTDYYDEYAKYTAKRARLEKTEQLADYDPRFYLMDYNTNIGVVISNLILGKRVKLKS